MQLVIVRGASWSLLLPLLMPAFLAIACINSPGSAKPTRLVAWIFLLVIAAGIAIAPLHDVLPRLSGMPDLQPTEGRLLTWYMASYCFFGLVILPPYLFSRPLYLARRGMPMYFSRFTCYLGLFTWTLLAVPMSALILEILGVVALQLHQQK